MDYLRAFRRSYPLVLLCIVLCGIGAFIAVNRITPQYTAVAQLIVSGENKNSTGSVDEIAAHELASARATSFSQIASTQPAITDAVDGAGYPPGTGLPSVSASAPSNEPFLDIFVTSSDRDFAARVANEFVHTLPGTNQRLDQIADAQDIILTTLSPAGVPRNPSSPNKKKDVGIGLGLGVLVGIGVALLREAADKTLRDSDAVGAATGLKMLGVVPFESPKDRLIAESKPRGIRTEAYRQVRTALLAADEEMPLRRLITTSATAGEGKTSLVANLAKVYSRAGHRVIVVDADLRRPKVGEFFEIDSTSAGLTDVLSGSLDLNDAIHVLDDGRLGILPAGPIPSNPSEALGGQAMERVIDQLSQEWEIVLIDTPPVLPVTDALILASRVDGVILVARLGETTKDKLRRTQAAIDKVNAHVVGLVANGAKADDDSAYRYIYGRRNKGTTAYIDVAPADARTLPTEAEVPSTVHQHEAEAAASVLATTPAVAPSLRSPVAPAPVVAAPSLRSTVAPGARPAAARPAPMPAAAPAPVAKAAPAPVAKAGVASASDARAAARGALASLRNRFTPDN